MPTSQSCSPSQAPKVVFAGAGPGAPDLITLRGRRALDNADLVVYAGSLVNPELLASCKKSCVCSVKRRSRRRSRSQRASSTTESAKAKTQTVIDR